MKKLTYDDYEAAKVYEKDDNGYYDINVSTGIYFLRIGEYVTYVGMSMSSIYDRIYGSFGKRGHVSDKFFDNIKIIDLSGVDRYEVLSNEFYFINLFNPHYNRQGKRNLHESGLPEKYIELSTNDKNMFLHNIELEMEKKLENAIRGFNRLYRS